MPDKKIIQLIKEISKADDENQVLKLLLKYSFGKENTYSKTQILKEYNDLVSKGLKVLGDKDHKNFLENVKMKKVRTGSGVTPVTVLTKPYPCPGKCIFCPNDKNMPKSYLSSEPGAQRAFENAFDPYLQVFNRLVAFKNTGHPVSKIELIVLGGTWSFYPETYRIWFIKRCFDAMNDFSLSFDAEYIHKSILKTIEQRQVCSWQLLYEAQNKNVDSPTRCTGLVIETRPDMVTKKEIITLRKLGVTKVQLGVQTLTPAILKLCKRGHKVSDTSRAFSLLREAGFKIQAHWMINLYGSNTKKDIKDFYKLFDSIEYRPDELKIYPCSLVENTELMSIYKKGLWSPYSEIELLNVLKKIILKVPRYCRVSRVVRDISSDDIVAGNKKTNFRQIVEASLKKEGQKNVSEIRYREIRGIRVKASEFLYKETRYQTSNTTELFLEYVTKNDLIAGFLRLSLPKKKRFIKEIGSSAIIREIHVYGESVDVGGSSEGKTQHSGLGRNLISKAALICRKNNFNNLSVISAIGTRRYYEKNGFTQGPLYQHLKL